MELYSSPPVYRMNAALFPSGADFEFSQGARSVKAHVLSNLLETVSVITERFQRCVIPIIRKMNLSGDCIALPPYTSKTIEFDMYT